MSAITTKLQLKKRWSVRETSEEHGTEHQAGAGWAMLYSSGGLTFSLGPSASGLRTEVKYTQDYAIVNLFLGQSDAVKNVVYYRSLPNMEMHLAGAGKTADLLKIVRERMNGQDMRRVEKAHAFAKTQYGDRRHAFLDMTILEQVEGIASMLLDFCPDEEAIVGALLQHTLRYGSTNLQELEEEFGNEVREIVSGLHLLSHLRTDDKRRSIDDLRIMLVSVSDNVRVVIIALCRRCHALEHANLIANDHRVRLSREALQLFAPVAARLGIYTLKHRLENAAFAFVYPVESEHIAEQLAAFHEKNGFFLDDANKRLLLFLQKEGVRAQVHAREKMPYSIFIKERSKNATHIEKIHDLFALRVIVESEEDCYRVLGMLHRFATPLSHRFKDYISFPKPNGYQSLHTCLIRFPGSPPHVIVEVQIRTSKMDREAEYGVAAHWQYKHAGSLSRIADKAQLRGVLQRQQISLLGRQSEKEDEAQERFADNIYVLTPKGDIIELPDEATPLDFAFAIHSDVGLSFRAARVNGVMVPISHKLENGDVVDILTHKQPRPTTNWLDEVRTTSARHKLRAYFALHDREKHLARGREIINMEFIQRGIAPLDSDLSQLRTFDGSALTMHEREELVVKIGNGAVRFSSILKHIGIKAPIVQQKKSVERSSRLEHIVEVEGGVKMPLRFAKCCNPGAIGSEPPIVGFITRTGLVTVHRTECGMLRNANPDRMVGVRWS